jgi:transposase
MTEIQTNLCNECMSTVLMLTLLDPTLAHVCYYTWAKTHEPWEYDYSIAFRTKLRHNISYTSITIIMKSISQQTQNDIISLLEQGKSCRQIGQEIGVHYSTVSKFHSKLNFTPPKGKGGCPSKLTPTAICHAIHIISTGKADTAVDVTKSLQETFPGTISASTVRRGLKKSGLKAVVKTKGPVLSQHHHRERLDFAKAHEHWTVEDWKRVIWSDGRKWVWKKKGEGLSDRLVQGTLKYGGGHVMLWGCFGWDGVGYACKIDGNMDADLYVSILEDELQESLNYWGKNPQGVVFQQDNDPKHTSKKAKAWLKDHGFEVMVWPPQSPDLNPIEHLWNHLKRKLGEYEEPPRGIQELWERVQKEWDNIGVEECRKLIESMPRRVEAVLKAKGGHTKY